MSIAISSLSVVLAYQHRHVIEKLVEERGLPEDDAKEVFEEAKKWLWLLARLRQDQESGQEGLPRRLYITPQTKIIDLMWHQFVLFTRDYEAFCQKHFGFFIHHLPTTCEEKRAARKRHSSNPTEAEGHNQQMLLKQMGYIYDRLGRDTVVKWYSTYPRRFGAYCPSNPSTVGADVFA